jgi:pimeloyl-ACP methyl ester carboxylesterase
LDASKVYLVGYSLGSVVALHAAAVLPAAKIAGVAAFGGWTPWRANADNVTTGGNRLLYETHALVPRLGLFQGKQMAATIPYDYGDLLEKLAPRPTLLYTPLADRFAQSDVVAATVATARKAWAATPSAFAVSAPDSGSDFRANEIAAAVEWVESTVLAAEH